MIKLFLKVYGNIKQNMKFREFLTHGIEKVRVEHNLVYVQRTI